ncbi:MAG: 30S ribosomal protein S18 [bacterium]|nr:30S ribosomal protein S18 [bacterium]
MRGCYFCTNGVKKIDYKEIDLIRQFTDALSKIIPKNESGLCAKHQRLLAQAIKRARFLALLPFTEE